MNKMKIAFCLMVTMGFAPAVQASTELVTNGGFETGSFAGWTWSGNTGHTVVSLVAHSGSYGARLGPVGSDGYLSESLATISGGRYNISFWLGNDGGTPNDFGLTFGANTLQALTNVGGFGYTLYSFSNVLGSGLDTLAFNFRQDPAFFHLDDVSVTAAAVPLPAGLPLLMAGLGGLGLVGRKSKKKSG